MHELTVGILTYKSPDLLHNVLQSIADTRGDLDLEVVVVDNASNDNTPEMVAEEFPWVNLICNEVNGGVAVGRNQIIDAAQGRYVCFLDCDTKVLPNALQVLVDTMNSHPEVSIGAPKLLYGDGRLQLSCRPFPSPMNIIIEGTFLRDYFPNSRFVKNYTMEDWDHNENREIEWMYGAAMIFRKEVFDEIGKFDEGFFFQYEDIDICYRARREAGMKILYIPDSQIIHYLERERKSVLHKRIHVHVRSIFRYLRKDYYGYPIRTLFTGKRKTSRPRKESELSGHSS